MDETSTKKSTNKPSKIDDESFDDDDDDSDDEGPATIEIELQLDPPPGSVVVELSGLRLHGVGTAQCEALRFVSACERCATRADVRLGMDVSETEGKPVGLNPYANASEHAQHETCG